MLDTASNIIFQKLPSSGERPPLFIIGDVHGCARELEELIKKARKRVPDCLIVLVGDLFTKGPDPVGVFELIGEYGAMCIKGNHDWALITTLMQLTKKGIENFSPHTKQTLYLIRHHKRAILSFLVNLPHVLLTDVTPAIAHPTWESSYPLAIVHAGIDPIAGIYNTPEKVLLTARYFRWDHTDPQNPKLVLVHASSRQEMTAQHKALNSSNTQRFRWHQFHNGPELIVFGHDAKQGLFRKTLPNGRPICIGLDTGCTYGRSLTGYFPELDDAIQVAAHRSYFDIYKNQIIIRPKFFAMPAKIESSSS